METHSRTKHGKWKVLLAGPLRPIRATIVGEHARRIDRPGHHHHTQKSVEAAPPKRSKSIVSKLPSALLDTPLPSSLSPT